MTDDVEQSKDEIDSHGLMTTTSLVVSSSIV